MAGRALTLLTPSSVSTTGGSGSASIGANGKVTFTTAESVSVNGVFSSTYDDYMMVLYAITGNDGQNIVYRLRAAGTDSTAANYEAQALRASGTSNIQGFRQTSQTYMWSLSQTSNLVYSGGLTYIYSPYLLEETQSRSITAGTRDISGVTGWIQDWASRHAVTGTAFDGVTLMFNQGSQTMTGYVLFYGFNK